MPINEEQIKQILQILSIKEQKGIVEAIGKLAEAIQTKEMPPQPPFPDQMKVEIAGAELVTIKGEPGHTPTDEELTALIQLLIPPPQPGHTPTNDELLALIRPLIPKVKDGETPTDEQLLALIKPLIPQVKDGEPGKDAEPIDIETIIEEVLKEIPTPKTGIIERFIGAGKTRIYSYDLSSQCDGNNKTFNVPRNFGIIGLFSTEFPIIYRPTIDYTIGNRTITLTSQVSAPQSGQTLICQYIV